MFVATTVKCPECGARLDIAGDAETARCAYCNTVSRVQRRTPILQLPKRLPERHSNAPKPIAREVRTRGGKIALAAVLLVGIGAPLVAIGAVVARSIGLFDSTYWEGHAVIADVDGDGISDFIGLDRNVHKDRMRLAAFSGKDGHRLWHSDWLGTYTDVYQDHLDLQGDVVLAADTLAHITAFDLKTGAQRWKITTPEVVDHFCITGDRERDLVLTKDKVVWWLSASDGKLERASVECRHGTRPAPPDLQSPRLVNAHADEIYPRTGGNIGLGFKQPGTRIPIVCVFADDGTVAWQSDVPGNDTLKITSRPAGFAWSAKEIAFVYERSHKSYELTVFDLATGARRYEVPVAKMNVAESVILTKSAVAVSGWGVLDVHDLATGEQLFTIGK